MKRWMKATLATVVVGVSLGLMVAGSVAVKATNSGTVWTAGKTFGILSNSQLLEFAQNNILYYDPAKSCGTSYNAWAGDEVTWEDLDQIPQGDTRAAITLLASTYGELAMALQEEYGVPWELVFIQMGNESGGGVNGRDGSSVAINIRNKDGKYNLLGMDVPSNRDNNRWASDASYPYTDGANGSSHEAAEYDSISQMIIGYVIAYYRNGVYDEALPYWGYENFDFWTGFATATCHYVGSPGSCSSSYSDPNGNGGWFYDVVAAVAAEKGWPSSEELAKQKQIGAGGNWPPNGDIRQEVWAAYGAAGLPSGSGAVTVKTEGGVSGSSKIAETAKKLAWPVGTDASVFTGAGYAGTDAYNKAAEALGGDFVKAGADDENGCAESTETGICYSCARFVSLAIYESGVDQEFNAETKQMGNRPHMIGENPGYLTYYLANSDSWEMVKDYNGVGYDNLMAGDVLIYDQDYNWGDANLAATAPYPYHTFIYVGEGIVAEASNSSHAPYMHEWSAEGNNGYVAFRVKGYGSGVSDLCKTTAAVPGDFDNNILMYAWPEWSATRKDARPEYQELVDSGQYYNGGGATDCNGFVTKMTIVNQIDPNYNQEGLTTAGVLDVMLGGQGWAANWETVYRPGEAIDTSQLRKGDVFLKSGHTFLFVGDIPGFQCDLASASLGDHVPVACQGEGVNASWYSGGEYYVFRKK